jgi:ribulose-phosphate 3-epimerase
MSVNPGFGGQGFIPQILGKIKALKGLLAELGFPVLIEVDGGIKYENAKEVADAGADILVMGSAFFNSRDYQALAAKLRNLFIAR